jgi:hypothetical protein
MVSSFVLPELSLLGHSDCLRISDGYFWPLERGAQMHFRLLVRAGVFHQYRC